VPLDREHNAITEIDAHFDTGSQFPLLRGTRRYRDRGFRKHRKFGHVRPEWPVTLLRNTQSDAEESNRHHLRPPQGQYGYRRITATIWQFGQKVNHKTVQGLMGKLGLKSLVRPKKYRSYKGEVGHAATNILQRKFEATGVNQKWVTPLKLPPSPTLGILMWINWKRIGNPHHALTRLRSKGHVGARSFTG
jgi:hypothetical protein